MVQLWCNVVHACRLVLWFMQRFCERLPRALAICTLRSARTHRPPPCRLVAGEGAGPLFGVDVVGQTYQPLCQSIVSSHLEWFNTGLCCSAARKKTLNYVVMTMRL